MTFSHAFWFSVQTASTIGAFMQLVITAKEKHTHLFVFSSLQGGRVK